MTFLSHTVHHSPECIRMVNVRLPMLGSSLIMYPGICFFPFLASLFRVSPLSCSGPSSPIKNPHTQILALGSAFQDVTLGTRKGPANPSLRVESVTRSLRGQTARQTPWWWVGRCHPLERSTVTVIKTFCDAELR